METENPQPQTGGLKLMTVFIAVLALHVLVIGGISAWHIFKRTAGDVSQQDPATESTETVKPDAITPEPLQADANAPAPTATDAQVTDVNAPASTVDEATHASNTPVTTAVTPIAPVTPVAPAPENPPVADTAIKTSMQEVTVKAGDSLYKIAKQNHTTVAAIKQLNGLANDNLKIGQKLKVEAKGAAPAAPSTSSPAALVATPKAAPVAKTVASSATVYTVSKGDTLTKIARQFKTTTSAIMSANKMSDPSKLSIGAKLKIPGQQASTQPVAPAEKAASAKPAPAPAPSSDLVMAR